MAQTKFDKQLEQSADSLVRGIGRALAGQDLDGAKRTDATFWRAGTRSCRRMEGVRSGAASTSPGGGVCPSASRWGPASGRSATWPLSTWTPLCRTPGSCGGTTEQDLATLEIGGIGAVSVLTVGTAVYMVLTRERRELMREWDVTLHETPHTPVLRYADRPAVSGAPTMATWRRFPCPRSGIRRRPHQPVTPSRPATRRAGFARDRR